MATICNVSSDTLILSSYRDGAGLFEKSAGSLTVEPGLSGLLEGPDGMPEFQVHVWFPGLGGLTSARTRLTEGSGIRCSTGATYALNRATSVLDHFGNYVALKVVQPAAEPPMAMEQGTEGARRSSTMSSAERFRAGKAGVINPNADDGATGEAAAWGQMNNENDQHRRRSTAEKFRESREGHVDFHGSSTQRQIASQHADEAKTREFMNLKRMCVSLGRADQDIARCSTVDQLQILAQTGIAPFEQPTEYQFGGSAGTSGPGASLTQVNVEEFIGADGDVQYHGSTEEQAAAAHHAESFQRKEFMTVKKLCKAQGRNQAHIDRCTTIEELRTLAATGQGPVKYTFGGASGQGLAGYKRDSQA